MVQSYNKEVDYVVKGTSFLGLPKYGQIMIGDKAFEFYNDRDINDYIQIPWDEVDKIVVSVMFKGKWMPRFAVVTKYNGNFTFAARKPKILLQHIKKYIPAQNIVKSLSFFQVMKIGLKETFKSKK